MEQTELAYKRKRRLRGKNRKLRLAQVADMDNLRQADRDGRRGKLKHKGVRLFDRDAEGNLTRLRDSLLSMAYHTSEGHECERKCPCGKVRQLHKLPYMPDHIVHHALMQIIGPAMSRSVFHDSFASIKGKGMHYASRRIRRWIDENKDAGRLYFAKIDYEKCYHRVVQELILAALSRKFGDKGVRYLLREVVTTCEEGLGIGLYPVQMLVNFYMSIMAREVMRRFRVRLFLYCDDISVCGRSPKEVWKAVDFIRNYAAEVQRQPIHQNIGVQAIDSRLFLDMVGYRHCFGHALLRKRMKRKFQRKMHRLTDPRRRREIRDAYKGWLMHCDGFRLWTQTTGMKSFKELNVPDFKRMDSDGRRILKGTKVSAAVLEGREVVFCDVEFDVKGKLDKASAVVQVEDYGKTYKFFTCNHRLIEALRYCTEHKLLPFRGTLVRTDKPGLPDYKIV